MATVTLSNGEKLTVPGALKRAIAATEGVEVSCAAQVSGDRGPALLLLAGAELVLVDKEGERRWSLAEIERVDRPRIVARGDVPLPIASWWYAAQSRRFLATVRTAIGQPPPAEEPAAMPAATPPAVMPEWGLALLTAPMAIIVGGLGAATWVAREAHWASYNQLFGYFLLAALFLSVPLLIASVKLIRREAGWMWLGIVGAAIGGMATVAIVLAILFVIAWGIACGSEGCLR